MWPWEDRTVLFQQTHLCVEFDLFLLGKAVPPRLEFIGVFDLPCHLTNMTYISAYQNHRERVITQQLVA
jgi:hypothetical protein